MENSILGGFSEGHFPYAIFFIFFAPNGLKIIFRHWSKFLLAIFIGQDEKAREDLLNNVEKASTSTSGTSIVDVIIKKPAMKSSRKRSNENFPLDAETSEYYDSLLGLWIATSTLPVSLVQNPHMVRFVNALNPQVKIGYIIKCSKANLYTFREQWLFIMVYSFACAHFNWLYTG